MNRASGILLHISSLPSRYGIGTLGDEAYRFVDLLAESGQSYWQILPIGPTLYGDSPYQSPSAFAGNPYFIDLEHLIRDGYIYREETEALYFGDDPTRVDYGSLYKNRSRLFESLAERFDYNNGEYADFCSRNEYWLNDYSLFMALKEENNGRPWNTLPEPLKMRDSGAVSDANERLASEVNKHRLLQFLFFKQWHWLKCYAHEKNVRIIGDMPIYVAYDSAEVWSHPHLFKLDNSRQPTFVAGCPPDGFSPLGQRWGNPIYNWESEREALFRWWRARVEHSLNIYDLIRIDHFRGFSEYYEIPSPEHTAVNGHWERGPGIDIFNYLRQELGELPIIAEDLGFLNGEVKEMLKESGFPGMKVLQFAFDSCENNDYLPHNYTKNCVIYTGTHDNDTLLGWIRNAGKDSVDRAKKYMGLSADADEGELCRAFIRTAMAGVGDTAIIPMQDILGLGSEARMNLPSSVEGNWRYRLPADYASRIDCERLREYTRLFAR